MELLGLVVKSNRSCERCSCLFTRETLSYSFSPCRISSNNKDLGAVSGVRTLILTAESPALPDSAAVYQEDRSSGRTGIQLLGLFQIVAHPSFLLAYRALRTEKERSQPEDGPFFLYHFVGFFGKAFVIENRP